MILIFQSRASYDAIRDEIVCTPVIEGGGAPVALQLEPAMAGDGVRCCIEYAFDELTAQWLEAYTSGENPSVTIVDTLPADWYAVPEKTP